MKSVKSRQNPFQPASSVVKTNHQTSRTQSLSKKKKKIALSPIRSNWRDSPQGCTLEKPNHHLAAIDGQSTFAESWVSTGSGSPPSNARRVVSSGMETPKQSARAGKSTVSSEQGVQQDSVLAKYMERFRHGQPQSREDRQQMASAIGEDLPFWWMSPSSLPPSSTPTKATDYHGPAIFSPAGHSRLDITPSPCRGPPSVCMLHWFMSGLSECPETCVCRTDPLFRLSILSDTSQGECDDTEILHLQERASRLLQRGECALSDRSILVSSEGLACSDFSSPISIDEQVRRPLIPSLIKSTTVKTGLDFMSSQKSPDFPSLVPPTRPEEDILFQWRLRRKMEQARECSQPQQHSGLHGSTFSWQGPSVRYPSANAQAYKHSHKPPEPSHSHITAPQPVTKDTHGLCPPAASCSSVSQPHAIAHVPAHMHLLCDVLPCPIQSSHASEQQSISQRLDESPTKVAPKKTQNSGKSKETSVDEKIHKHNPSPSPASSGAVQGECTRSHHKITERNKKEKAQTKDLERNEKKKVVAIRKQKKLSRCTVDSEYTDGPSSTNRSSSHQRVSKKVMSWTEQQQQEFSSESCTDDHAPPPSPIHCALGQVVSEVLFPAVDSSPAQTTPVLSVSPPCTASAPPQSSVPPGNAHNSMEVISQLLQEAEDSDGKEFEDDPLLQVLRKQRKWVKEQISEVDSMLDEVLDEQHIT
ncbi:proline and serine-rich protein 3 isoform X3 [Scomber scombrus]|uniref:proline and serine-rich protein 3 isoform X3 n=1 Tax=Scomber scombrus TaxID=13677 RepID=UPI002DDAB618|nr:proline and serine-rich protein 3 isoform X3 [Scomber scombrus]